MWICEYSIEAKTTKDIIWKLWTDVQKWPTWSHDLEWSQLTGPFTVGARGRLKPKQGPAMDFELTEVNPRASFIDESKLPLFTTVQFVHQIDSTETDVKITHSVIISGPLTFIFARIIGKQFSRDLPIIVRNLAQTCEEQFATQRSGKGT